MTVAEESETDQQVSEDSKEATVLKICLVQPKSLQECSIIFSDAALASLPPVETFLPPSSSVIPPMSAPPPSSALPPLPAILTADIKTEHLSPKSLVPIIASSPLEKTMSNIEDVSEGMRVNDNHVDATRTRSNDDLADAASKISLLSSNSFKPLLPTISSQDIKDEESSIEAEDEPENEDDSEYDDGSVPMLQSVNMIDERDIVSGNSSPSREVATILSIDDRRFKEENDTTLKESPSPEYTTTNYSSATLNTSGGSTNYSSATLNTSGTIFPDPPTINSSTLQPTITNASLPTTLPAPGYMVNNMEGGSGVSLEALVRELQGEVKALRQEVSVHRTEQISKQVEVNLAARLEGTITRSLTVAMTTMEKNMKKQEDKVMDNLTKSITKKCDQILSMELKRNVAETVTHSLEPLKARIDSQIAHKLRDADQIVRESVLKMVSNHGFQESISKSVAQTLQPVIAQSYKEVIGANLPGVERMLKQVLSNVNETFIAGTREYETALRGRLEASEVSQRDEISPYLRDIMRSVGNLTAAQNKLSNQLAEVTNRLDTELPNTVAEIVKKEIRVLDKPAPPPSPQLRTTDIKEIIQGLVSNGRLNDAFQSALSANDLGLVMFTCELVNTTQIFSQSTCPLSQSVLLSLIQQLSIDLQDKTEVKFQFLEEAIIHLDKSDNVTKTHIGSVLMTLQKSAQAYTQSNANTRFSRNFKTLMMAANGLLAEIR